MMYIKIDNGVTFEGTQEQFENCFFSNADPSTIFAWGEAHHMQVQITNFMREEDMA